MKRRGGFLFLPVVVVLVGAAWGGHELPIYPSYYPHEIRIETVDPERAAGLLRESRIQAYVGGGPRFAGAAPDSIRSVESLGSFVIVSINPNSALANDEATACAMIRTLVRDLSRGGGDFIFHPYPVTPLHGDYLDHADLAEAAKASLLAGAADAPGPALLAGKVQARGALAQGLVPPEWRSAGAGWDAAVEDVDAADLVASAAHGMNGWLGPPWLRAGWFHAALLLGGANRDPLAPDRIAADLERLESGAYGDAVERINLERDVTAALAGGCRRIVAGYTVKREFFSAEFSAGIENIGFDAIAGLNSPIFIRTVKLKDFPWNGWLSLGIGARPTAAWNPIAGFGDGFGRLMWSALGDPALIPSPGDAGWMLNRIADVKTGR